MEEVKDKVGEPKNEEDGKQEEEKKEIPADKDAEKKEGEEAKAPVVVNKEEEKKAEAVPEEKKVEVAEPRVAPAEVEEEKKAVEKQPVPPLVVEVPAEKGSGDLPKPEEQIADPVNLKQNFELFRLKKENQEKCDKLLKEILNIETNKDLLDQLQK